MTGTLALRGICYDTGTRYIGGVSSREPWHLDDVDRDMAAIASELHCNSVAVFGSDLDRLVAAAGIAQRHGLAVSLQLRPIDTDRPGLFEAVAAAADACRTLAANGPVTLNIGCELSLFMRGFLPGRTFLTRMKALAFLWPTLPLINFRLNRVLNAAAAMARPRFDGPITYAAGTWESVDWTPFDLVGVDLYRDRENEKSFAADLDHYLAAGKPLVITEFGCCTFEGAERLGGGGWLAIDHGKDPPEVKPGFVRSEQAQARLIGEMIDLFAAAGVHGAYVFTFMESGNDRSDEPRLDLDTASYGIVAPAPATPDGARLAWTPKLAFHRVATSYAQLARAAAADRQSGA
jgi:hypothetical protein